MNLIEQLGDDKIVIPDHECYQYHKESLEVYEATKHLNVFGMTGYRANMVRLALIQYRRENNIFEEGDAIVRRWNNRVYWIITDVDNGSEFMISENKNAKFKDCKVCDMPCNFTFATDKEIAQGYRDE